MYVTHTSIPIVFYAVTIGPEIVQYRFAFSCRDFHYSTRTRIFVVEFAWFFYVMKYILSGPSP